GRVLVEAAGLGSEQAQQTIGSHLGDLRLHRATIGIYGDLAAALPCPAAVVGQQARNREVLTLPVWQVLIPEVGPLGVDEREGGDDAPAAELNQMLKRAIEPDTGQRLAAGDE